MIPVTKSYLPPLEKYQAYLERIWESNWLTNRGALAKELEEKLCEYLDLPNLLFVSNGTIALQIAIKALSLKGEIITTPFSYVATTSSIVWENCNPVFVDIDRNSLCIDANKIEDAITQNTSAILATHVYGIPCDVEKIEALAKKHNLKVIYDAAHCFGVNYKGSSLLSYGDISTISFHATKLFHTGEGGGVIINNKLYEHEVFYRHNFGHNGPEDFFGLGINGKNSELHAAMGLCILPKMSEIIEKRKSLSELYDSYLLPLGLRRPVVPMKTEYNYAYYPVIFPSEELLLKTQKSLNNSGIFPRRYFYPSLNTLEYIPNQQYCEVSEDIAGRVLCLPLYWGLKGNQIDEICRYIEI